MKTAEELATKHAISKNYIGYGAKGFMCQIHYPELCKIITEDRQSIVNKIRGMIGEIKPDETIYGSPEYYEWVACIGMLTNLIQWIEGGSE